MNTRTITFEKSLYRVTRLYSSGVGTDFTVSHKDAAGKEVFLPLSLDQVEKNPEHAALYEACLKAFDDHLTYAKHIGSSSFWQSGKAPVPGTKT
jgi:hypothetical protein